jgi:hypothetical protein
MSDLKTSLLVNRQVPEFVREEHPKFISFLEAYYEFLDNTSTGKAKDLRDLSDVDVSLAEFEQQFFNSFLPFIPRNTSVNKEFLIKNILPLYLTKGSEKSYKLLFRMLFGEEVKVENPGRQILRASDGRWSVENFLRVRTDVYSEYISDGEKDTYFLPYVLDADTITVYINDTVTTDYEFRREYKKIIFNEVPDEDDVIKIEYANIDTSIFDNRRLMGLSSGASSIVEKVGKRTIAGLSFLQFFINERTTLGNFQNGELVEIDIQTENASIPFFLQTFTDIGSIEVVDGGSNYLIGDPVLILGASDRPAVAIVDDVTSGLIDDIILLDGGSGYQVNNEVIAEGFANTAFLSIVDIVDTSGVATPNTLTYNTDVISDFGNVTIGAADYGFPTPGTEDQNTVIANSLSYGTISNIGGIVSTNLTISTISSLLNPQFTAISPILYDNTRIGDLGTIGRIDIINGGLDYLVGDKLVFTNVGSFGGQGANAEVSQVNLNGSITRIKIVNGGLGYNPDFLPSVEVVSNTGSNAVVEVGSIMGLDAEFEPEVLDTVIGRIRSIKLLESGAGYITEPTIDLTRSGDGNATANAIIRNAFVELPGKWTTSDSLLSSDDIRLQGRDYYINYAYVLSSKVEFNLYKSLLKNLLHPSGLINYSKYSVIDDIESNVSINVESYVRKTVAGRVNVTNTSTEVIGINTFFTLANTLNILTPNTVFVVNNQIRSVVSIDDDETLTVNTAFTITSNNDIIKILS